MRKNALWAKKLLAIILMNPLTCVKVKALIACELTTLIGDNENQLLSL